MSEQGTASIQFLATNIDRSLRRLRNFSLLALPISALCGVMLGFRGLALAAFGSVVVSLAMAARLDKLRNRLCLAQLRSGGTEDVDPRVIALVRQRAKRSSGDGAKRYGLWAVILLFAALGIGATSYLLLNEGVADAPYVIAFLLFITVLLPALIVFFERRTLSPIEQEILALSETRILNKDALW